MSPVPSGLGRWWQGRANVRMQQRISRQVAAEAVVDALPLGPGVEDRIWRNIARELPVRSTLAEPRVRRRPVRVVTLASSLAAAAVGLVLLGRALPRQTESATAGLKGREAATREPRLKSLRYAVVGPNGAMTPGEPNASVAVGSPILFSVEAGGVEELGGATVDLEVIAVPGSPRPIAAGYHLTSDREILTGKTGYLAFTPQAPGVYQFTLTTRQPERPKGEADALDITINVVRP